MGGRIHQRRTEIDRRARDATGKWRAACAEFAGLLGFRHEDVWDRWTWIAGCLEFELQLERVVAEEAAWQRTVDCFDKRGCASPN